MLEEAAKNLWLLLTLVIPGLCTYGAWRAFLLLEPGTRLNSAALSTIDSSAVTSASIIVAVALLQQAIAIVIESILAALAKHRRRQWPHFYSLFCERFALAAAGKLNEDATRIIGNMFLSINMSIGLVLLLIYFLVYEPHPVTHWVPLSILVFLLATCITAIFRMANAKSAIALCKNGNPDTCL